jgi:KDO2-lipid IV(A) lauroyltransferase
VTEPQNPGTPRRWTLHGLNNGLIFTATYHGVRALPRVVSYGIGHIGTWIAWRTMRRTRDALAHNLAPLFPGEDRASLDRRALQVLRSYALDVIDFLRAISVEDARGIFDLVDERHDLLNGLLGRGKGLILVTGHYGNWELGSILITRALGMPLTVVAMAETDPTVNRIRRDIREALGVETIEVRQSLDTPLQIRRHLAHNRVVAMLIDRHYGRDRTPVAMFGRAAWILRTPLLMAYVTGAPILPCSIERIGPGRYKVLCGEPILLDSDRPRDEAIARGAQQVADAIADRVREHPEYWYQFYRYWDAQRDEYHGLD